MRDFSQLPEDIIINHILPFTYQPQSKQIMRDIIIFTQTFATVYDHYSFEYNDTLFLNDLIYFFCFLKKPLLRLLRPHKIHIQRMTRLYWGKLKPRERLMFITKYC